MIDKKIYQIHKRYRSTSTVSDLVLFVEYEFFHPPDIILEQKTAIADGYFSSGHPDGVTWAHMDPLTILDFYILYIYIYRYLFLNRVCVILGDVIYDFV